MFIVPYGKTEASLPTATKETNLLQQNPRANNGTLLAALSWKETLQKTKEQGGETRQNSQPLEDSASDDDGLSLAKRKAKPKPKLLMLVQELLERIHTTPVSTRVRFAVFDLTAGGHDSLSKYLGTISPAIIQDARIRLAQEESLAKGDFFDIQPLLDMNVNVLYAKGKEDGLATAELAHFKERQERLEGAHAELVLLAASDAGAKAKLSLIQENRFNVDVVTLCAMSGT